MAEPSPNRDRLRVTVLAVILAVVAVIATVYLIRSSGITTGSLSADSLEYTAHNLPLLELREGEQAAVATAGSAGNPFAFRPPPTPTRNLTPQPTPTPRPTLPPRPTPTPRIARGLDGEVKPPPPPFDREYIGHLGPKPGLVAAFRKGSGDQAEVEVAAVGDVIEGVFILRSVGLESVTIGFVGYDVSEDTSVPLSEK